jgi:integrase
MDVFICLKMILTYAVEKFNIPFIKYRVQWPISSDEPKKELEVYSPAEQKIIINYIMEHLTNQRLAVLITLCTGMRIGEICALRWENVDVEAKCIRIRQTLSRVYDVDLIGSNKGKTKIIFSTPKTSGSYRDVPLNKELLAILKTYKKISNDKFFVATGTEHFTEPRTFRSVYERLILNEIKLPRIIHFHGLRHTFASRLVSSGVDVKTASRILGHADISTTLNLYVHPSMDNKIDAVNKSLKGLFK